MCFWGESFIIWVICTMKIASKKGMVSTMTNQELCILLESLLALLETNNNDKAKTVIENAIRRIDKSQKDESR